MFNLNVKQQIFLTQYISLILIILCLLVGKLYINEHLADNLPEIEQIKSSYNPHFLQSEFNLENAFDEAGNLQDLAIFDSFKDILENHKVNLNISVTSNREVSSRISGIVRQLKEKGFWAESYTVEGYVDAQITEDKLKINLIWE